MNNIINISDVRNQKSEDSFILGVAINQLNLALTERLCGTTANKHYPEIIKAIKLKIVELQNEYCS